MQAKKIEVINYPEEHNGDQSSRSLKTDKNHDVRGG